MSPEPPAKVLWISCVGEKGGAEVYMLNLLRRLDRRVFAPAVALLRPGPLTDDLKALEIPIHFFPAHRMRNFFAVAETIRALAKLIRAESYSLVHSNGFRAHVYGGLAARLARVPELWTTHTVERPGLSTEVILSIPSAQVIANAPRTADHFIAHGLATTLLWPSVDADELRRATPAAELAHKFNLPPGARWICLGARLQRYKGHEFFLRALAALPPEMSDARGVVIGGALFGMEQSYLEQLKSLAASLNITDRVCFTGFVSDADLRGFLARCEMLVHPALEEDFGLIVAEAQALGKSVLAFASSGPAAIVRDGETGRLVPAGDQAALSTALREMLASPERLRQWGAAGRERALRRFGAEAAAAQLARCYAACLGAGGGSKLGASTSVRARLV